ncbi:hypothetical protein NDU88_006923 [Pleurodeles waltl]|uniref:Uncharacterized protein n=1 Tax=Pleurodeles waltl TaxID=8319 RepID=A0AAV7N5G6_PLEWA|nr:hypothetical protein NDU88_006923 [Pleurodeles waltl]
MLYRTPEQLHKMGLLEEARCIRCLMPCADFLHLVGDCLGVRSFWTTVFDAINERGDQLRRMSQVALLGYVREVLSELHKLITPLRLLEKRQMAMHWGHHSVPQKSAWLKDVVHCQDNMTAFWELNPIKLRPKDIWAPLKRYLRMWVSNDCDDETL